MGKFKKFLTLFLSILFILLSFTGCNSTKKIDKFYTKLSEAESITVEMEMEIPVYGTVSITMKQDDKIMYSSSFLTEPEYYEEIVGETTYKYVKNSGVWTKSEIEDEEETDDFEEIKELFKSENYEYDKSIKKFKLKDGISPEIFEGMQIKDITLEFADDNCIINGDISSQGILMPFKMTFKDINNTTLELPTVA